MVKINRKFIEIQYPDFDECMEITKDNIQAASTLLAGFEITAALDRLNNELDSISNMLVNV